MVPAYAVTVPIETHHILAETNDEVPSEVKIEAKSEVKIEAEDYTVDENHETNAEEFMPWCSDENSNTSTHSPDIDGPCGSKQKATCSTMTAAKKKAMADRKTSQVWQYYIDLGHSKAECYFCGASISYKGAGCYNLTRHTLRMHPGVLNTNNNGQSAPVTNSKTSTKTVPKAAVTATTNYHIPQFSQTLLGTGKTDNMNKYLVELIAKTYLPFDIVEAPEFVTFVQELNPNYQMPSKRLVSNTLLDNCVSLIKEKLKMSLVEASFISLTTDSWTSPSNDSYLAVTAHFLDKKTELKSYLLDCHRFNESHTAGSVAVVLEEICEEWKIENKIVTITTDHCSNIKAAIGFLKWLQIPCFAHTLDLIVKSGLIEIEQTICKIKKIVELFRNSPLAAERLRAMQKQLREKELKLKQDDFTRWYSTFDMFERVLESRKSITLTIAKNYSQQINLTDQEFEVVINALKLLTFFKDVAEEMSTQKGVLVSEIVPISNALRNVCERFLAIDNLPRCVRKMAERILLELQTHYRNIEEDPVFADSTFLDPRFKVHGFMSKLAFKQAVDRVMETIATTSLKCIHSFVEEKGPSAKKTSSIWNEFDEEIDKILKSATPTAASGIEVHNYLKEPLLRRNKCPLSWWEEKKDTYPRLYKYMQQLICIPVTSIPAKQVFSKSGQILMERRNRLKGSKVSKLVFLHSNM